MLFGVDLPRDLVKYILDFGYPRIYAVNQRKLENGLRMQTTEVIPQNADKGREWYTVLFMRQMGGPYHPSFTFDSCIVEKLIFDSCVYYHSEICSTEHCKKEDRWCSMKCTACVFATTVKVN